MTLQKITIENSVGYVTKDENLQSESISKEIEVLQNKYSFKP